ncbi:hypothetical protein AB0M54_06615 [Actinoplanes sp. NPDC051470]|uniref:hypothetical protein n=1 Tax=Actinoplanes sp. NPDC051470 TaxID=3157224 RepID=UPI00341F7A92
MKHNLDRALRDAAEPVPARVTEPFAQQLLDDILRSDPGIGAAPMAAGGSAPITETGAVPIASGGAAPIAPSRPRPRPRLRLAVAGAALALAATAVLAVNSVGAERAYASWTPDPSPLPAAEAQALIGMCLPPSAAAGARVAISEKRGRYAFVNVVTAEDTRTCFRDRSGGVHESSILLGPAGAEQLGARGIEMYAWPQLRTGEGWARLMAGRLGSQITGVTITVRGGGETRDVRATVRNGYFAAWYPEDDRGLQTNDTTLRLQFADHRPGRNLDAGDLLIQPVLD